MQPITLKYVPHGVDPKKFYPITKIDPKFNELKTFAHKMLKGLDIEFVVLWNSRNITRKRPGDVILSFRQFTDLLPAEKAKKCVLIMHTQPLDENGTDLREVKKLLSSDTCNIIFSDEPLSPHDMNYLYNLADITMLISSAEGWGLSLTESMMAGTMILANMTGGMIDQMRFEDENGEWIKYSSEFPSNHNGTYMKCGEWALPVKPNAKSLVGSIPTPYIYDTRCSIEDIADQLFEAYKMGYEERKGRGLAGREWVMSDEAKMTSSQMAKGICDAIDATLESWKPKKNIDVIKIQDIQPKKLNHELTY